MTALNIEAPGPEASQDTLVAHLKWCGLRRAAQSHDTMRSTCYWCRSDEYPTIPLRKGGGPMVCSERCKEAWEIATKAYHRGTGLLPSSIPDSS